MKAEKMKKEDFWRLRQYPTTPPDDRLQPSDDVRWEQYVAHFSRRQQGKPIDKPITPIKK